MATPPSSSGSDASPLQNSLYIGVTIQNILYGVELILYFKTIRVLSGTTAGVRKKLKVLYAVFSSMMVFLITVWVVTTAIFCQKVWLQDSNYPGGPDAYFQANISDWYLDWGTTAVILLQLMTDGLMIHRCRVICNSYRTVIVPMFLWFSTLVLGALVDWTSSLPGGDFFAGVASQLALAYYAVSVFLNTLLTCMICYRIVRHGLYVRKNLGRAYATPYFATITLVVESVLPYTLSGIPFLVSLGVGSTTSEAFISVYVMMMCISPQMLILRVLAGRSLDNDISLRPGSVINFTPGGTSGLPSSDGSGTRVDLQTLSKASSPDGQHKVATSQV